MKSLRVYARLAYPDARSYSGRAAAELRQFVYDIKGCKAAGIMGKIAVSPQAWIARQVAQRIGGGPPIFGESTLLVPVPSSGITPPRGQRAGWAGYQLVTALQTAGLGTRAILVHRMAEIESAKMSRSRGQERPTIARHLATMTVAGELPSGPIVLVDDLLTRGTQLAACVELLRRAGYRGKIRGFAAAYWTSDTADPEQAYEGDVQWEGEGYANRTP